LTGPASAKPVSSVEVQLTVCLMNDAAVPWATVGEVEQRVDALLVDSAIHIRWLHGGDPSRTVEERWMCSHPEALRVLMLRWMATSKQVIPGEMGEAFLGKDGKGAIADLFLDPMDLLARESGVNFAQLLAHVTAHELGHLLLGADAHSVNGLMRARMNENSFEKIRQGNLCFSREQEKKMHARVKAAAQWTMLADDLSGKLAKEPGF
jgi:hypothetical protein